MATLTAGPGQTFTTLAAAVAAARPGDVVQLQAGTYTDDFPGAIAGLTIEGVGGTAKLVATRQPPNGKGYLDVTGGDVTLRNLDISGVAVPDQNGAGVRYEGGDLTLDRVHLHHNENGILGTNVAPAARVTIQNSEIDHNGVAPTAPGASNSHNVYISGDIGAFTLTGSYVHDAAVGHEVKSRAEKTTITNNRIFDNGGTSSYSIDLPQGGNATITGNVIEQGPNGGNPAIVAYGEESSNYGARAGTSVVFTGNTVVNDMTAHAPLLFWNAGGGTVASGGNTLYGVTPARLGIADAGFAYTSTRPALDTAAPGASTQPPPAAPDTLVLHLSEDAWRGDARFVASLDGHQLGPAQSVTASHGAGGVQDVTFQGAFGAGPHDLAVGFLNDAWGGTPGTDRNLYVDGVDYDGARLAGGSAALYSAGTVHFHIPAPTEQH